MQVAVDSEQACSQVQRAGGIGFVDKLRGITFGGFPTETNFARNRKDKDRRKCDQPMVYLMECQFKVPGVPFSR